MSINFNDPLTIIVSAVALALGGAATAQTAYSWTGSQSDVWEDADNWSCGGCGHYPGEIDDDAEVTIDTGQPELGEDLEEIKSLTLDGGTLDVLDGGVIEITDGMEIADVLRVHPADIADQGRLVLPSGSFSTVSGTSGLLIADGLVELASGADLQIGASETLGVKGTGFQIAGTIALTSSSSELKVTGDTVFNPVDPNGTPVYGQIEGFDASAEIRIMEPKAGDTMFVSNILLHGMLTVEAIPATSGNGTATFVNEHQVFADADGVLALAADLLLDDESGAVWGADSHTNAVLRFNQGTSSLSGDFVLLDDATLDFNASVSTTGCFDDDNSCGTVDTTASGSLCFGAAGCGGYTECGIATLSGGCP